MIGITNAGGGSGRVWMCTVYGGTDPPPKARPGDIFIRTTVPVKNGEITPNVLSKPSWGSAIEGYWYVGFGQGGRHVATNKSLNQVVKGGFAKVWQSINGQWQSMDAYVLEDNSTWTKISSTYSGELFYQGDQFTDVTGGWVPTGYRMAPWNEGWGQASPKMDIGTNMTVYQESNPNFGTIFTSKMIDVTNYRALKANVQYNLRGAGKNNGFWLGVCTNGLTEQYTPLASFMAQTDTGEKSYDGDISIDISGITGRVFVFIAVVRQTHVSQFGTNPVTFRKIWLE